MAVHPETLVSDIERTLQQAPHLAEEAFEEGLDRAGDVFGSVVHSLQEGVDGTDLERELREAGSRLRGDNGLAVAEIDRKRRDQAAVLAVALVVSLMAIVAIVALRRRAASKRAQALATRSSAGARHGH